MVVVEFRIVRQSGDVIGRVADGVLVPHQLEQPLEVVRVSLAVEERTLRPTLPHFGSHAPQAERHITHNIRQVLCQIRARLDTLL